jgi:hypothetical protein
MPQVAWEAHPSPGADKVQRTRRSWSPVRTTLGR